MTGASDQRTSSIESLNDAIAPNIGPQPEHWGWLPLPGPPIPRGHELFPRLSGGFRTELPEVQPRAERRRETPITGGGSQRADMHVELVGQDLQRQEMLWGRLPGARVKRTGSAAP